MASPNGDADSAQVQVAFAQAAALHANSENAIAAAGASASVCSIRALVEATVIRPGKDDKVARTKEAKAEQALRLRRSRCAALVRAQDSARLQPSWVQRLIGVERLHCSLQEDDEGRAHMVLTQQQRC